MKIKGISIFEQHAEKFVLLVFALLALGIFVLQFDILGDPNAVKVGTKDGVSPEDAVEVVRTDAQRLKGQMEGEGGSVDIPALRGQLAIVREELERPVWPRSGASLALARSWSEDGSVVATTPEVGDAGIVLGNTYNEVTAPAPRDVLARAFAGTIDPLEPVEIPELAVFLPAEQPFDKRAVTVQATFDSGELIRLLGSVPEDKSVNPLPNSWWQGRVEILGVELIREEVYEDGTSGPEGVVGALPGRASLRDRLSGEVTRPRDLPDLLRDEAAHREEIRRPAYYRMIAGDAWVWPGKVAGLDREDPQAAEVGGLVLRYRRLAREAEKKRDQIRKLGEMPDEGGGGRPSGGPQRGDAGPGGWPSIPPTWYAQDRGGRPRGGDGGGDGREERERKRRQQRLNALKADLEELEAEMEEIATELKEEYGRDADGKSLEKAESDVFTEAVHSLTGPNAGETVTLWAHDIEVEPGKSYRYKMRVLVANPLFGHLNDVPESQQALAGRPAVASAESAWSEVVRTYPERVYFVSSAIDAAGGGSFGLRRNASASVDLYEFFYGFWRGGGVSLDQGDRVRVDVELPEGLPIFEIEEGKVAGSTDLERARTVSEDAILLEVGRALGAGDLGEVHVVIFGTLDGDLAVHVAEIDAESGLAGEVWASRERGQEASVLSPGTGGKRSSSGRRESDEGDGGEGSPRQRRMPSRERR